MLERTSYPIPEGYRMLRSGETIKVNDLYWSIPMNKFEPVPKTPEFTGEAEPYGRHKHACLIRQDTYKRTDEIRPDYYKQGGIEVITIIRVFKLGFNLGNVLKYILRAGLKSENRLKDLQKANTYLQFELGEEHGKETNNKS